jgi:hypothetical protein
MPAYVFKGIEMLSMMGFTGFIPESHSPAYKIIENMHDPEQGGADSAITGLIETGMLAAGSDGKIHGTKEAAMLMKILCKPSQIAGIRRPGVSGSTEYYLLKLGSLYCLYLTLPGEDIHLCQFPLDTQMAMMWFDTDMLTDMPPFTGKASEESCKIDSAGYVLLQRIQDWYGKKATAKMPLDEDEMWFSADMLLSGTDVNSLTDKFITLFNNENSQDALKIPVDNPGTEKQLRLMVEAGILKSRYKQGMEYFCYSPFMMLFMDPVLLRDTLFIKRYYPEHKVNSVYLKTNGIFIMDSGEKAVTFRSTDVNKLRLLIL